MIIAAVVDHVKREVLEKGNFDRMEFAEKWAEDKLAGWKNPDDKIVKEQRDNGKEQWTEIMIETAYGDILDYYVEIHERKKQ